MTLTILAFFQIAEGKNIEKNMKGYVSPNTVKPEEFGTIPGTVADVTEFPLDFKGVNTVLKNDELAKMICKKGPPIMAKLYLREDPSSVSGFKWTSKKGPDHKITAGTICTVTIVIRQERPIELFIPFIKECLGLE